MIIFVFVVIYPISVFYLMASLHMQSKYEFYQESIGAILLLSRHILYFGKILTQMSAGWSEARPMYGMGVTSSLVGMATCSSLLLDCLTGVLAAS